MQRNDQYSSNRTHLGWLCVAVTPGSQYTEVFLNRKKEVRVKEMPLYFAKTVWLCVTVEGSVY